MVAKLSGNIVESLIASAGLDAKLGKLLGTENSSFILSKAAGMVVHTVMVVFFVVESFGVLHLRVLTRIGGAVIGYLPQVLTAVLISVVFYIAELLDCVFLCFTNATLIDEAFADEMLRVGNFVPSISLEGFEEATDGRRGDGVYQKVMKATDLLRRKKLFYGISACYTSANFEPITSEAFFDSVIDMGAYFIWYFHYMPVGNDAAPELMPNPVQRREMYRRIRKYRLEKPLFAMDFQNDAEYVGGCIAGGRRYFHINANGDIDPCVFIHYSDSNIREKTILEALKSPMMMAYHDGQPFNENMLRPCPMLENPEKLRKMVAGTEAHSTDLQSPETVEHLCAKCDRYAQNWRPVADELWNMGKEQE